LKVTGDNASCRYNRNTNASCKGSRYNRKLCIALSCYTLSMQKGKETYHMMHGIEDLNSL